MSRLALVAIVVGGMSCSRGVTPIPYIVHAFGMTDDATTFAELDTASVLEAALDYPEQSDEPPMSLTGTDGTGLELVAVEARGVVDGPLAFTELHLTFNNPQDRQREGRFEITLPPGAAVSRFAMKIGSSWRESEVVERMRSRQVYESHLHRRVDPALLETKAGNAFRARVFPIAAKEHKQLIVSYSHELASADDPYVLPVHGLPKMSLLDIHVRVGDRVARLRRENFTPEHDFEVDVDDAPSGVVADSMIAVRVAPEVLDAADSFNTLFVLFDTSASGAAAFQRQVAALHELVGALQKRRPALTLTVAAFDQTVEPVYRGKVSAFGDEQIDALLARRPLGASNLELALRAASRASDNDRVLLIGDGIVTAGATRIEKLREALVSGSSPPQRLDVLAMTSARDEATLRGLSTSVLSRDGVMLSPVAAAGHWVDRMSRTTAGDVDVRIAGARWVWPERLGGLQTGGQAIVFAQMRRRWRGNRVDVALSGNGVQNGTQRVRLADGERALMVREWAQARIDRLLDEQSKLADDSPRRNEITTSIVELSMTHRVVTPLTAMLVLETDNDYQRFGLSRTSLADIISVDATGLRVLRRGSQSFSPPKSIAIRRARAPHNNSREVPKPSAGTGAIQGTVTDRETGENLAGVTVVATSPALNGTQSAITGGDGTYLISELPPGDYTVTYYYSDITVLMQSQQVVAGKTTPVYASINTTSAGGEVIDIAGSAPIVDTTTTSQGVTLDSNFTQNIPVTGRTFESALGAAAGTQNDGIGVSFSASMSLENTYVVEGVNTTGVTFGTTGGTIDDDFFDQMPSRRPAVGKSSKNVYTGRMRKVMKRIARGDSERAIAMALRWRAKSPGDIMAVLALGEALEARGYYALAARAYGSIADLYPSRAEMIRYAAARLLRFGTHAASVAADLAGKAVKMRPDHPSGFRLLALCRVLSGDRAGAFEALADGLKGTDPRGRFDRARGLFEQDIGVLAAAWLAKEPSERHHIRELLDDLGVLVPIDRSLSVVLSWETDANDVDLYVTDAGKSFEKSFTEYGHLLRDVTDGFGPEAFVFTHAPSRGKFRLWAHYAAQEMMGHGFGYVQILAHDGAGNLAVETRPFAVMTHNAYVDLGPISTASYWRASGKLASRSRK